MKIWSNAFSDGGSLPEKYAFSKIDEEINLSFSSNINPAIFWSNLPAGTQSLVLTCVDKDVPVDLTQVNLPGVDIPRDALRKDFYHWLVANIDPALGNIAEAISSKKVSVGGRSQLKQTGFVEGINDYTDVLKDDQSMAGKYFGYDGPFPPLNDTKLHWYEFKLYALGVSALDLPTEFTASDVIPLLQKHYLGTASIKASYSYNSESHSSQKTGSSKMGNIAIYPSEIACILADNDIDTDAIIPQTELVTTTKSGLGKGLFARNRYLGDGSPNSDYVLNKPENKGVRILISGKNFGCGSSREHAVWALKDFGVVAVIAISFGEIFYRNSVRNGLVPALISKETFELLMCTVDPESMSTEMSLDLTNRTISWKQHVVKFDINEEDLRRIIYGIDDIDMTLSHELDLQHFANTYLPNNSWLLLTDN